MPHRPAQKKNALQLPPPKSLRGEIKLRAGLDLFDIDVSGVTALDVGASTGGFTKALLAAGAKKVYAVDAGFGQLLGSLRQDQRVVNLERLNVGQVEPRHIPDQIDFVVVDVSYLPLRSAIEQLTARVRLADKARLLGLVKPMFELRLATAPTDRATAERAISEASEGAGHAGWTVVESAVSAVSGGHGAIEGWIYCEVVTAP